MGKSSIAGQCRDIHFGHQSRGKEFSFVSPASPTCQKLGKEKADFVAESLEPSSIMADVQAGIKAGWN